MGNYFKNKFEDEIRNLKAQKIAEEKERNKYLELERQINISFKSGYLYKQKCQSLKIQICKALEYWGFKAVKFKMDYTNIYKLIFLSHFSNPQEGINLENLVFDYLKLKKQITNGLLVAYRESAITKQDLANSVKLQIKFLFKRYKGERSKKLFSLYSEIKIWLVYQLITQDWLGLYEIKFLQRYKKMEMKSNKIFQSNS